jgi:hypothetical protein
MSGELNAIKTKRTLDMGVLFITNHISVTPTDVGTIPLPSLNAAAYRLLERLYWGIPLPPKPITEKYIPKEERNALICERYAEGETLESISATFALSIQRVH